MYQLTQKEVIVEMLEKYIHIEKKIQHVIFLLAKGRDVYI